MKHLLCSIKIKHMLWPTRGLFKWEAGQDKKFRGYLRYKTTTSQNVPSEAQVKNLFIFNHVPLSRYSWFFLFLTIPWFTTSVTSSWVLIHETECIFEFIFWTTTHWVTKLGQVIDISKGKNFQESFEQFGRLRLSSWPFSI